MEISCYSVQSALNAENGGAHRVELCAAPPLGGITPSYGMIELTKETISIPLFVIVRPRGGDFLYSETEFEVMKRDIRFCKEACVDGIVIGVLKADGRVDTKRTEELIRLARPMEVTFHRAFDMTADPFRALEDLIGLGVDRVLTSGQKNTAWEGKDLIKKLVERAGNDLIVMPGAGINEINIGEMATYTGAEEFHSSAGSMVKGKMIYRNPEINMGGMPGIPEYDIYEAEKEKVSKMVKVLSNLY
jgi:copper homeostasis protein